MQYTVSKDGNVWYCHHKDYPYVPVFGSIGTKQKALKVMRERNKLLADKQLNNY